MDKRQLSWIHVHSSNYIFFSFSRTAYERNPPRFSGGMLPICGSIGRAHVAPYRAPATVQGYYP